MREAVVLFVWLMVLLVAAVVVTMVVLWLHRYVLAPMPYRDPEPPVGTAGDSAGPAGVVGNLILGYGVRCQKGRIGLCVPRRATKLLVGVP